MYDNAGYIKLTLPNSAPSLKDGNPLLVSGFSADTRTSDEDTNKDTQGSRNNILLGQYLEQKLPLGPTDRIYVFGLPYTGAMSLDESTGEITATLPLQDNSGMGFYLNANPNKELGLSRGQWTRNNWYVYNNKVYYHATGVSSARNQTRGVQFVPVVFADDEDKDEQDGVKELRVGDGCAYDLLGRRVATAQQVRDGSWIQSAAPGIYIVNGKKVFVGKANAINGKRNY